MSSATQANSHSDERAIRSLIDTWLKASEQGDLPTLLNLMEDDVVFMTPGREPFGKQGFIRSFEQLKSSKLESKSDIKEIEVLGEWAWLHNYLSISIKPDRGESTKRSGHILSILHRGKDGQWRIARDANMLMSN